MALFIAVQAFATERRGRSEMINPGDVAGSRSWVVATYPEAFRPLEVRWPDPAEVVAAVADAKPEAPEVPSPGDQSASPGVSPASLKPRGPGRPRKES